MTDQTIVELILGLESAVWQALVDGDRLADESLLADDFVGVYPSGFAHRQDHVDQLSNGPTVIEYAIGSTDVAVIAEGQVRLSYEATYRRTSSELVERMYVTSLWSRRNGRWSTPSVRTHPPRRIRPRFAHKRQRGESGCGTNRLTDD